MVHALRSILSPFRDQITVEDKPLNCCSFQQYATVKTYTFDNRDNVMNFLSRKVSKKNRAGLVSGNDSDGTIVRVYQAALQEIEEEWNGERLKKRREASQFLAGNNYHSYVQQPIVTRPIETPQTVVTPQVKEPVIEIITDGVQKLRDAEPVVLQKATQNTEAESKKVEPEPVIINPPVVETPKKTVEQPSIPKEIFTQPRTIPQSNVRNDKRVGRSLLDIFLGVLRPHRTDTISHFFADFFLPTVVHQVPAVHNAVHQVFYLIGAFCFDAVTFPVRVVTCVPRMVYNRL